MEAASREDRRVSARHGGCEKEKGPRVGGERRDLKAEMSFKSLSDWESATNQETAGDHAGGQLLSDLREHERVSSSLCGDPLGQWTIDPFRTQLKEKVGRITMRQSFHSEFRESFEHSRWRRLSQRENEREFFGFEPAGNECDDFEGLCVDPLGIIDYPAQGMIVGGISEQAQYGKADQKEIGRWTLE